jgi:hypothetical protein
MPTAGGVAGPTAPAARSRRVVSCDRGKPRARAVVALEQLEQPAGDGAVQTPSMSRAARRAPQPQPEGGSELGEGAPAGGVSRRYRAWRAAGHPRGCRPPRGTRPGGIHDHGGLPVDHLGTVTRAVHLRAVRRRRAHGPRAGIRRTACGVLSWLAAGSRAGPGAARGALRSPRLRPDRADLGRGQGVAGQQPDPDHPEPRPPSPRLLPRSRPRADAGNRRAAWLTLLPDDYVQSLTPLALAHLANQPQWRRKNKTCI